VPIEETLEALNDVVRAGKALHIGASSMFAWQLAKALRVSDRHGWARFQTMQNYVNLLYREEEREMLPLCKDEGIGVIPWSPLARGRLARDFDAASARSENDAFGSTLYEQTPDADRKVAAALAGVAKRLDRPRAQVALAWVLAKSEVTAPIVGATRLDQLDDAVAALTLVLAPEDIAELEAPYVPHPVIGHE
jgi:aryl-alcohol dehydrogenase-like predicted oxidoreductase